MPASQNCEQDTKCSLSHLLSSPLFSLAPPPPPPRQGVIYPQEIAPLLPSSIWQPPPTPISGVYVILLFELSSLSHPRKDWAISNL